MKTLAKTFIFSVLMFIFSGSIIAQPVESMLQTAVPELYGALKITESSKYDKSQKQDYRDLYYKLDKAKQDIQTYRIGALTEETVQVFEFKELRKLGKDETKIDSLEEIVLAKMVCINDFMKWDERLAADSLGAPLAYVNFKDLYKAKKLDEAYVAWKLLFNKYPIISSSIYSGGASLVSYKISKAETEEEQQAYIDTLFMVYEQQVKAYPQTEAYVRGREAVDYHNYYLKGKDLNDSLVRIDLHKNFKMVNEAIEIGGKDTKYYVFPIAMKLSVFEYMLDTISAEQALDNYLQYTELLNIQIEETEKEIASETNEKKKEKKIEEVEKIKKGGIAPVDMIFTKSDLSTCEHLVPTFQKKFDAAPEDPKNLKKILSTLGQKGCVDSTLYSDVAIALYNIEPSAEYANNLGMLFASKEDYEQALKYFDEAINSETVDSLKAKYYFSAAQTLNKQSKYSQARDYCRKSLELNPDNGKPHILIATMYAATANSVGSDAFEHQAVYWVVVDRAYKAKNVDPSVEEAAQEIINKYSSRYPSSEEGFMRTILEGSSYTVGGWIGESTTVRYNN